MQVINSQIINRLEPISVRVERLIASGVREFDAALEDIDEMLESLEYSRHCWAMIREAKAEGRVCVGDLPRHVYASQIRSADRQIAARAREVYADVNNIKASPVSILRHARRVITDRLAKAK